jgi:hypothetical protein
MEGQYPLEKYSRKMLDPAHCFPIMFYVLMLFVYVLCFKILYSSKLELIGFALLFVLHVITAYKIIMNSVVSDKNVSTKNEESNTNAYFLPPFIVYLIYDITGIAISGGVWVKVLLLAALVLVLVAMIIFMISAAKQHKKFSDKGYAIDWGDKHNKKIKDTLKKTFVIETALIWVAYLTYANYDLAKEVFDEYLFPANYKVGSSANTKNRSIAASGIGMAISGLGLTVTQTETVGKRLINMVFVGSLTCVLLFSGYSVFIADELAKRTGAYVVPKSEPTLTTAAG